MAVACGWAILLTACGSSSATSAAPSTTGASSSPTGFTSPLYGYTVDLPEGWRPEPATESWSGVPGDFGSDSTTSDRFHAASGETIWAVGAPTTTTLDRMIEDETAADAANHDCDAEPDSNDEITLAGEPARLTTKNCPVDSETVIATVAVIHGDDGYLFYFIHPETLTPDANAVDTFTDFLAGVTFPN